MALLENISVEELHDALEKVDSKKPTQRLQLAILYKQGPSVPMIADWFDMRDDTIYRWFREMEQEPLLDAIHDEPPPGRPSKLTDDERNQFEAAVQNDPSEVGSDAPAWTTSLARQYLAEEFDVEYTPRHVRRLLKEAGLSFQTPRPQPPTAEDEEREEFRKDLKKTD
jgi:transposase